MSVFKMPTLWKTGEIIPASKKTIAKVNNDLRPITLTAILSKCTEQVVLTKCLCYVKPSLDITSNLPTYQIEAQKMPYPPSSIASLSTLTKVPRIMQDAYLLTTVQHLIPCNLTCC